MGMLSDENDPLARLYPGAEQQLSAYLQQQAMSRPQQAMPPQQAMQQPPPQAMQQQQMDPAMQFANQYRAMMQQSGMLPPGRAPQPSPEDLRQAKIARDLARGGRIVEAFNGQPLSDPNASYNAALSARMAANPEMLEYARQVESAKAMREMTSPDLISYMGALAGGTKLSLPDFLSSQRAAVQPGAAEKDMQLLAAIRSGRVPGITEQDYNARQASRGGAAGQTSPIGAPIRLANGNVGIAVWDPQTAQQEVRDTGAQFYEEPSATVQNLAAKAWDAQTAAAGQSSRAAELEGRVNSIPDSDWRRGVTGQLEDTVRQKLGVEDLQSVLQAEYRMLSLTGALKNLPPGPATDRDVQLVLQGTIPANASKTATVAYLRGLRKIAAIEADRQRFTGEYIAGNPQRGILGLPQAWSEYAGKQKGWLPETQNAPAAPTATMRWNPETRKLEPAQ